MKKYTKKQIKEAFIQWEIKARCQPQEMITDDEMRELSVDEVAKQQLDELLKYMN